MIQVPTEFYLRILPEIVLSVFAVLIMLVEGPARGESRGRAGAALAVIGSLTGLLAAFIQAGHPGDAFNGMFRVDGFTSFFTILLTAATVVVVLLSIDYLPVQKLERGEFYSLLLFATVGMGFMVGSVELIMIFIALEITSIASYILAGFRRNDAKSNESSLKYLLLGSFATAFFLYGIALYYGATGSTHIGIMAASPVPGVSPALLMLAAAGLMFVGLGFKVSAAPFQVWTPDVYQGAPAPVTGFMSAGPKAAAFAVFLRIFYVGLHSVSGSWFWLVWAAAILSMCIGNITALRQTNLKRMLAYSSIAQAGYVLVALACVGTDGASAVLFYLAAYVAMNLGAFAVIAHLANREERCVELKDYAGIGYRFPLTAFCLSIFLFSLIGVPLTGGFFGKLYIFESAFAAHRTGLAIIAVLNSALAAYYYLRVIVHMYMHKPGQGEESMEAPQQSLAFSAVMVVCVAAVLWLGIFPSQVLDYAKAAGQLLH